MTLFNMFYKFYNKLLFNLNFESFLGEFILNLLDRYVTSEKVGKYL
jgi:hypothetical protein